MRNGIGLLISSRVEVFRSFSFARMRNSKPFSGDDINLLIFQKRLGFTQIKTAWQENLMILFMRDFMRDYTKRWIHGHGCVHVHVYVHGLLTGVNRFLTT